MNVAAKVVNISLPAKHLTEKYSHWFLLTPISPSTNSRNAPLFFYFRDLLYLCTRIRKSEENTYDKSLADISCVCKNWSLHHRWRYPHDCSNQERARATWLAQRRRLRRHHHLGTNSPGLFAVNISILTGHRLRGTKGSVVATIASCLPPFLIILLVAIFFTSFKDNPYVIKAFKGIRPVVVALIGVPMIDMLKATKMRWWSWIVWIASMTLVCLLSVSPIYILICVIVVAAFISWYNNRKAV